MAISDLKAYQAAQQMRAELDKLGRPHDPELHELYGHANEAVDSLMNNLSEGIDSIYPGKKKSSFDIGATSNDEARNAVKSLHKRGAWARQERF